MDVHKETISIAVLNSSGRLVMQSILETKVAAILHFFQGLRGSCNRTLKKENWRICEQSCESYRLLPSSRRRRLLIGGNSD